MASDQRRKDRLAPYRAPDAFGPEWGDWLTFAWHFIGSYVPAREIVRLCPETAGHLYTRHTPARARYRRGSYIERQQMKWLALFMGVLLTYSVLFLVAIPLLTGTEIMEPGSGIFGVVFYLFCGLIPPLVIGIAILRHHLWNIDLIIRRTLVYTSLTLILFLLYSGVVVLLQSILTAVIGHAHPIAWQRLTDRIRHCAARQIDIGAAASIAAVRIEHIHIAARRSLVGPHVGC